MENYELTLSEYWRIMRKRQGTIALVFALVMISTVIFTKLQTPIYQADLELKIERHQPMLAVNSTGQGSVVAGDNSGESDNLTTDKQLITSLPVLKKVAEKLEILPSDPEEREKALHVLALKYRNFVTVEQIHGTDILDISTRSSDPKKAALMATAIADVYGVENVNGRKRQSRALINYIDQQLSEYHKQLATQESQLQKFNQNEKVFEVTPKVKQTLDRMTIQGTFDFESEMIQIDNELKSFDDAAAQGDTKNIFDKMTDDSTNYIFVGLKRRLLELEFERFLLLIDYTEKHPAVIAQDKIIAEAKTKIVNQLKQNLHRPITPVLESDLALAVKKLFLETRKEVLYRIVNKFYGDSGSLSSNQVEYLGLKRNVDRLLNSYDGLVQQRDEARLNLAKVIDDVVMVVSPAEVPQRPIKPNALVNYLVSCAVGLLLGMIIAFIKESVDSSISTIHDVEQELNLTILGIIPHIGSEYILSTSEDAIDEPDKKMRQHRARLITISNPKSWPAESYKMLRSNLLQQMKTKNIKTILFTSSDMQEGKSLTVSNIAISMAQLGKKTLLLGCNMRRPTDYKIFGLTREPGLSDILMGHVTWSKVINSSVDILIGGLGIDDLLQIPGIDNLSIITSGRAVDNVSELLNSQAFDHLLRELKAHFEVIIIDCSPVMAVPDAVTISDRVDGVVLIYKVGQTPKEVLKMAKSNLLRARANLLGIILNNIKTEAQVGYSAFSYRYYGEKPEKNEGFFQKLKKQFQNKSPKDNQSLNA